MKVKIHYCGRYEDELIVEGDTFDDVKEKVLHESDSRGWERDECWSEEIRA